MFFTIGGLRITRFCQRRFKTDPPLAFKCWLQGTIVPQHNPQCLYTLVQPAD